MNMRARLGILAALIAVGSSGCGEDSDSGEAYARRVETATSAFKKVDPFGRAFKKVGAPGDDLKCRALTLDDILCTSSVSVRGVDVEGYHFAHFDGKTLSIGITGGSLLSFQPETRGLDCEGDQREECIDLVRGSGAQFHLKGSDGPLGEMVRNTTIDPASLFDEPE